MEWIGLLIFSIIVGFAWKSKFEDEQFDKDMKHREMLRAIKKPKP